VLASDFDETNASGKLTSCKLYSGSIIPASSCIFYIISDQTAVKNVNEKEN